MKAAAAPWKPKMKILFRSKIAKNILLTKIQLKK